MFFFWRCERNPEWNERGIVGRIRNATVWPQGLDTKDVGLMVEPANHISEVLQLNFLVGLYIVI